jgi:hypothetical protein
VYPSVVQSARFWAGIARQDSSEFSPGAADFGDWAPDRIAVHVAALTDPVAGSAWSV